MSERPTTQEAIEQAAKEEGARYYDPRRNPESQSIPGIRNGDYTAEEYKDLPERQKQSMAYAHFWRRSPIPDAEKLELGMMTQEEYNAKHPPAPPVDEPEPAAEPSPKVRRRAESQEE